MEAIRFVRRALVPYEKTVILSAIIQVMKRQGGYRSGPLGRLLKVLERVPDVIDILVESPERGRWPELER
jgi:hypothetical protein